MSTAEPHPDGWFALRDGDFEGGDAGHARHESVEQADASVLQKPGVSACAYQYFAPMKTLFAKPAGKGARWTGRHKPYNLYLWGRDTGHRAGAKILIALKGVDCCFGDGEVRRGVATAEDALSQMASWTRTGSAAFWHSATRRLIEKPKDKGSTWSRGDGTLFMWVDRYVGPSQYDSAKAEAELAKAFGNFDAGEREAAETLASLAREGETAAIFGLCCRLVSSWSVEDEMIACDAVTGGLSGASLYRVQRRGNRAHDTVIFRAHEPSRDSIGRGKNNGVGKAAMEVMSSSPHFPLAWTHQLLENVTIMEFLAGGDFDVPTPGLTVALDTAEDAASFGTAVAQMHGSTSLRECFDACTRGTDPLDSMRDQIARSKHGPAMLWSLAASRSDEMASLCSVAIEQKKRHLCKVLPRLAAALPPDSLLGRGVVGHLDLHGGNLMRREAGGRPGDLVLVDFDRVCLCQAANDLGGYLGNRDGKMQGATPWPTLENRRACARAYINATPVDVLARCSRTSLDEVVLDMEVGALMRDAFICVVITLFVPGELGWRISEWLANKRITECLQCYENAKTDSNLKERIIRHGLRHVAGAK